MLVIDASAAVDFLLGMADRGVWVEHHLEGVAELSAPALLDIEVASALRGLVRRRVITARRAGQALDDLADFRVAKYPHAALLPRVWRLRGAMSAYDAAYVALAEALDVPLVTTDARLARAGGHMATVKAFPF